MSDGKPHDRIHPDAEQYDCPYIAATDDHSMTVSTLDWSSTAQQSNSKPNGRTWVTDRLERR